MTDGSLLPLEEVLDMLLDEFDTPSGDAIAAFSKRFPLYRSDLMRFAAAWAEEASLPEPGPLSEASEATLDARAQSFLQNALYERASGREVAAPASGAVTGAAGAVSLAGLAQEAGRTLHDVARAVNLPLALMSELNARGFRPETIPARLARRIADQLGTGTDRVRASFAGSSLQPSMAFLPNFRPRPQRDFEAAVRECGLSPKKQKELLQAD